MLKVNSIALKSYNEVKKIYFQKYNNLQRGQVRIKKSILDIIKFS